MTTRAEAAATVDCEQCAFRYGAEHTLADGTYSCPECDRIAAEAERDRLAARVSELEAALREIEGETRLTHAGAIQATKIARAALAKEKA